MADLEQVVNDLNLASQSLQELREKYDGALDLLDNKNTQITGALDSAKSNALQEIQTISDTATSQISQLKDTSLNLVNEAKNTATTEISNKKEEHKQELETKKNEYINKIDAKANEYDIANINAQVKAMDTKITEQINGAKTELNSKIDNKVTKTGDETIAGVKTFSVPPVSATNPTANNQVANKSYVDTVGNSKVALSGNQTIAGVKTFSSSIVIPNATANNHATNLGQLNSKVAKTGDETIAGVKTFSVPPVSATNPTANNQVANKSYVDTVGNSKVALSGNQTIAGVKTFNAAPVCGANPTQDAQLARKWYVDYGGGIKNLGNQTAPKIDLRQAQHFILTMTARGAIGIANWGGAGKSGTITVNNAQNITAFSAPFKFRVAQSGFSGTETFAYFCIASNNVLITRT
ncbi:hypothetical protein DA508_08515 [Campylobacter coli]|uniref:hypothetical protein n=1 Tax=Campylobacter coli TaxID=195 RepID=UPI0008753130|nr:hypothetical protein [Campylobacter coli]EAI8852921.1 hypothetical protein [Campylobacter coli]EAI8870901.1 hypothetical protein [Campylobacter coli]EAI8902446.1 hypothetical protein [Campylobacter coli]EAI8914131.1 hypothetical protein [Campylobacter coli]EAI8941956.1 hypothetical protein [Campylobacter coli]